MTPKHSKARRKHKADPNVYPEGWDYDRARKVADYYDKLKDQPVLEKPQKFSARDFVWMEIPAHLTDKVQKLIATKRKSA